MEIFNTISVIAGIISIISLIVFFGMASNVSAIKREMEQELSFEDYIDKSNEEKYIGNKVKAKEWLLRAEYQLIKKIDIGKTELKTNSTSIYLQGSSYSSQSLVRISEEEEETVKQKIERIKGLLRKLE